MQPPPKVGVAVQSPLVMGQTILEQMLDSIRRAALRVAMV